ncbi:MAG: ferredoxin [Candidatus Pacebacteria bacterium]|nr:ferredoxin [Candidatus Paceibacterota bacterium]
MKIKVDKQKCLGCGVCISLCPEVFELKDGKSEIKEKVNFKKHKDSIKQVIETCPTSAILMKDSSK